jgi:hypothetical protein
LQIANNGRFIGTNNSWANREEWVGIGFKRENLIDTKNYVG